MKIAFIADLHLPADTRALQYDAWEWAMADIRRQGADAVVCAGDITCDGNEAVYTRFIERMQALPMPFFFIPGNADRRDAASRERLSRIASPCCNPLGGIRLYAVNDADATVSADTLAAIEQAGEEDLVFMHHPIDRLKGDTRQAMQRWRAAHPQTALFAAHRHIAAVDGSDILLQALDPDKASGGYPAVTYYDTATRAVTASTYDCPPPADWREHLGVSCYKPEENIFFAIDNGIRHLELRPNCLKTERQTLTDLIARWRQSGGQTLSVHLPEVGYADGAAVTDERLDALLALAAELRADRFTQHVPKISVRTAREGAGVLDAIATALAARLNTLPHPVVIGVENMHMTSRDTADDGRRFGYLPQECLEFMHLLAGKCLHRVGINFDIGHARNNAPYSQTYQTGTWLAAVGEHIVGYHIHQVTENYENHMPITDFYGKLISYSSLFRCWADGRVNKAPLVLEMRPADAYAVTLAAYEDMVRSESYGHT